MIPDRACPAIKSVKCLEITIRNAWITILIPLEYFDVTHMKSLQKLTPPEFSDVIIA